MIGQLLRLLMYCAAAITMGLAGRAVARDAIPRDADLIGVGKETSAQLFQYLTQQYGKVDTETTFYFYPLDHHDGIKRFSEGNADFLVLDSGQTDFAPPGLAEKLTVVPVVANAVVLIYNLPGFEGNLRLSRAVYASIFTGEITAWNDERIAHINPGLKLPELEITTVHRSDPSHTTLIVTRHLSRISDSWQKGGIGVGISVDWPGNSMGDRRNAGVAMKVQRSHGSIGYVDFSTAMRGGMPMAALENSSGEFIAPSAEATVVTLANLSVATLSDLIDQIQDPPGATSYPIVACRWMVIPTQAVDRSKSTKLTSFIDWILTEGQSSLLEFGYSPLPEHIRDMADAELRRVK